MKDLTMLIGQLGGLSTALFLVLYLCIHCCTKKKYEQFIKD